MFSRQALPVWQCFLHMRYVSLMGSLFAAAFVDIADPAYNAAANAGISFEQVRFKLHGLLT